MKRRILIPACSIAGVLLCTAPLAFAGNGGDRIPVTDPTELQLMGFAPDAENVFITEQALNAVQGDVDAIHRKDFGTDTSSFTPLGRGSFQGRKSTWTYDSNGIEFWCTSNTEPFVEAQFHIPNGAEIQFLRIWVDDLSAEDADAFLQETCLPNLGAGQPSQTVLASLPSSGNGGNYSQAVAVNATVDNKLCEYQVRFRMDNSSTSCSEGANLKIQKARIQWIRQISPAPGTATFGDVPTGHPFFQHVEALVDSGITAGCGSGNYCPNDNLTRGQMAVFLAKALGLHWGGL